jgi:hypothetical protein
VLLSMTVDAFVGITLMVTGGDPDSTSRARSCGSSATV